VHIELDTGEMGVSLSLLIDTDSAGKTFSGVWAVLAIWLNNIHQISLAYKFKYE